MALPGDIAPVSIAFKVIGTPKSPYLVEVVIKLPLAEIKSYNSHILVAHFNGNPATIIIVHYAPVGDKDAIDHCQHLSDITCTIPKHNVLLVIGDCNAHLRSENTLYTFHDKTNNNGKLLLHYSIILIIANTRSQKKRGKLFTFTSEMNNCQPQIDYILINK